MNDSLSYSNAPYSGGVGWTRHWLMKEGQVVAEADTHPASGLNAIKLSNLHVPPGHRGHGYGQRIILAAIGHHPGRDVVLTPNPWKDKPMSKQALVGYYGGMGFRPMDGERWKDLMIFHKSPAFALGEKAAATRRL